MAIQIVTGKKYHILTDLANKVWSVISFWTKASDVEFNDGKTAQTKLGAIDGITSDLNGESETIAASIKAVNKLNNNLKGFEPILDSTGKITGYKTSVGGADTVFPFHNINTARFKSTSTVYTGNPSFDITLPSGYEYYVNAFIVQMASGNLNVINPIWSTGTNVDLKGQSFKKIDAKTQNKKVTLSYSGSLGTYLLIYSYIQI